MRLINADTLRDDVLCDNKYDNDTVNYYLGLIDTAPTIETIPLIIGKWRAGWVSCDEDTTGYFDNDIHTCSECCEIADEEYDFCPNCGAKMN